jgi:hypothetical protein
MTGWISFRRSRAAELDVQMMRRDAAIVNEMEFRMSLASKGLSPRSRGATMQRFLANETPGGDLLHLD